MIGGFGRVKKILEHRVAEIGSVRREGSRKFSGMNMEASGKERKALFFWG